MARRHQVGPHGQLSSLPLDILQKVASLMPLKDWARASGACRFMHTLQLDVISVSDPLFAHEAMSPLEQPPEEHSAGAHRARACHAPKPATI